MVVRDINRPPEIAEGVGSVDWLPDEATDISYYRSYTFTAYEFQISEVGFRKWAATAAYEPGSDFVTYQPVVDIEDLEEGGLFPIDRYNYRIERAKLESEDIDYSDFTKATSIRITNGLLGEVRRGSAAGYSIGYDRDTGTAYWQSNPR